MHALNASCPAATEIFGKVYEEYIAKHETQWRRKINRQYDEKMIRTSDSVRSIRSLLSSVRFSEDLFSSSPSSLKTLTSSSLPRSSPPPLLLTCGIIVGTRATATVFPVFFCTSHLPIDSCSAGRFVSVGRRRISHDEEFKDYKSNDGRRPTAFALVRTDRDHGSLFTFNLDLTSERTDVVRTLSRTNVFGYNFVAQNRSLTTLLSPSRRSRRADK